MINNNQRTYVFWINIISTYTKYNCISHLFCRKNYNLELNKCIFPDIRPKKKKYNNITTIMMKKWKRILGVRNDSLLNHHVDVLELIHRNVPPRFNYAAGSGKLLVSKALPIPDHPAGYPLELPLRPLKLTPVCRVDSRSWFVGAFRPTLPSV